MENVLSFPVKVHCSRCGRDVIITQYDDGKIYARLCECAARQDNGSAEQQSGEAPLQQLKAEIRALIFNSRAMSTVEFYSYICNNFERLRELSAV